MKVKAQDYIPDANFTYPEVCYEIPQRGFYELVRSVMKGLGARCLEYNEKSAKLEAGYGRSRYIRTITLCEG